MLREFFRRNLLKDYIHELKYYVQIMERENLDYDSLEYLGMNLGLTDYIEKELGVSESTLFKMYLDKYDTNKIEANPHFSNSATPTHCRDSVFMRPEYRLDIGVKYLYRGSKERVELARFLIEQMIKDYNYSVENTWLYKIKKLSRLC